MKREYSKEEMEQILRGEAKIPKRVDEKMQDAYRQIRQNARQEEQENMPESGQEKISRKKRQGRVRGWKVVLAAATLSLGASFVVVAANKFLQANLVEKDETVQYEIQVNKEQEAHQITAEPTYIPDGYVYSEDGPYGGKWHNEATGGTITVITYNAAQLDEMSRLGNDEELLKYKKDSHLDQLEISGMKTDVFVDDNFYVDSEKTIKNIYLFNEEYGYGVRVWSESDLPAEELVKVAEGMEIRVLDEIVPYTTDEEIEVIKKEQERLEDQAAGSDVSIPSQAVHGVGEEVQNPYYEQVKDHEDDIRYTVQSVEVKDQISTEGYPAENFVNYDEISAWMNEDGSLKPHERYTSDAGSEKTVSTVDSKYVVVRMEARNAGDTQSEWNASGGVSLAPTLTELTRQEDGTYRIPNVDYHSANEGYSLQYGGYQNGNFAQYFDAIWNTEGTQRMKAGLYRPMAPGETLDYTLIYVVDEDRIDDMVLWFYEGFSGYTGWNGDEYAYTEYVAIGDALK